MHIYRRAPAAPRESARAIHGVVQLPDNSNSNSYYNQANQHRKYNHPNHDFQCIQAEPRSSPSYHSAARALVWNSRARQRHDDHAARHHRELLPPRDRDAAAIARLLVPREAAPRVRFP